MKLKRSTISKLIMESKELKEAMQLVRRNEQSMRMYNQLERANKFQKIYLEILQYSENLITWNDLSFDAQAYIRKVEN